MHSQSILKSIVLVIAAAATWPAWAQSTSGWYAGVGMNATRFAPNRGNVLSSFTGLTPASTIDADSFNLALLGGYRFDDFLALQGDLFGGGSVRATEAGQTSKLFDVSMFTISAKMSLLTNERLNLYCKLGGTFWTFSQGSAGSSVTLNDGFGPSFGAGLDINLYGGGERRMRLEWTHHRFDGVLVNSANSFVLGAVFFF